MYNISSNSNTILSKGDEETFLKRKLLLLSKLALVSVEVFNTEKYSLDETIEYLINTLCDTQKIWLSKDESEILMKDGCLTKTIRFLDLKDYKLQLQIVDKDNSFYLDTQNLENNYRSFVTKDMIGSYSLVSDDVVTINVRH